MLVLMCVGFLDSVLELLNGALKLGLKHAFGIVGVFSYLSSCFGVDFTDEFCFELFIVGGSVGEIRDVLVAYVVKFLYGRGSVLLQVIEMSLMFGVRRGLGNGHHCCHICGSRV